MKVAITQLAMDLQLWNFAMTQNIKKYMNNILTKSL